MKHVTYFFSTTCINFHLIETLRICSKGGWWNLFPLPHHQVLPDYFIFRWMMNILSAVKAFNDLGGRSSLGSRRINVGNALWNDPICWKQTCCGRTLDSFTAVIPAHIRPTCLCTATNNRWFLVFRCEPAYLHIIVQWPITIILSNSYWNDVYYLFHCSIKISVLE